MKFSINRILPPEEAMGNRGREEVIKAGALARKIIEVSEDGKILIHPVTSQLTYLMENNFDMEVAQLFEEEIRTNPITLNRYILEKFWMEDKGKTYYFPKRFATALGNAKLTVGPQYLPENFIGYFAYAERSLFDGTTYYSGAYVSCRKARPEYVHQSAFSKGISHIIKIVFLEDPNMTMECLSAFILKDKTIEESLRMAASVPAVQNSVYSDSGEKMFTLPKSPMIIDSKPNEFYYSMVNLITNSLCYVMCLEPDIQHLKPENQIGKSEKKQERPIRNYCTIPLKLVNWNFEVEQERTSYERKTLAWEVSGHFRWQPYGPERMHVKMIWIDSYMKEWKE